MSEKKLFAVVAGARLAGKTTIAGTLPGTTLMLQAAVLESGSRSAKALAKKLGNTLIVETFSDLVHLRAELNNAAANPDVDHIYIDGYSAINDMRWAEPDVQAECKKNEFAAYRKHGDDMTKLVAFIKSYTYGPNAKNVWLSCALKPDTDDVALECKGRMAVTAITKMGEAVLSVAMVPDEQGKPERRLITKTFDKWPGRIDGVLDEDNPQFMEPDLSLVLKLIEGDAA